jgi:uncharacterized protein YegL
MSRRLPVYLLVETSARMRGDAIASVELGIKAWHTDALGDPSMIEAGAVSLITFGGIAKQASKLTDVMEFQVPTLTVAGSPCLGAALQVLTEAINVEVKKATRDTKGDWKPMVFVFTAGAPDEIWKPAAHELKLSNDASQIFYSSLREVRQIRIHCGT